MERVFPLGQGLAPAPKDRDGSQGALSLRGSNKEGAIERKIAPGKFIVLLDDGGRLEVSGSAGMKIGNRVKISLPAVSSKAAGAPVETAFSNMEGSEGLQWFAAIPLAFGGKKANARLQVFVERKREGAGPKADPAVYLVFTVQTEACGETQWNIHLKGRQVTLQVFAQWTEGDKERLNHLIRGVETALREKGYWATSPALLLSRPFKVPAGFRLNLRG